MFSKFGLQFVFSKWNRKCSTGYFLEILTPSSRKMCKFSRTHFIFFSSMIFLRFSSKKGDFELTSRLVFDYTYYTFWTISVQSERLLLMSSLWRGFHVIVCSSWEHKDAAHPFEDVLCPLLHQLPPIIATNLKSNLSGPLFIWQMGYATFLDRWRS